MGRNVFCCWTQSQETPDAPTKTLKRSYVFRLRAFLALGNLHGYLLPFMKAPSTGTVDGAEVYKNILAAFLLDEAESLLIVKPLNGTFY